MHPSTATTLAASRTLLLGSMLLLGACSTLPKYTAQPVEYAFHTPTDETALAKIVLPLREKNPQLTGYHILYEPLEALAARLHLIERAEKSLDLQYYIWDNDKIGKLALEAIIRAADRGVKVRLLVDDMNSKSMQASYLALDQHINIDVRLYNPHRFRQLRAMDMVLDLKRINRRMHNKSFIADNQFALIGGRNMGDMYYNISERYQFADLDVLLVGAAADEIIHSFDEYWNDDYAYPVLDVLDYRKFPLRYPELKQELVAHAHDAHVQNYLNLANRSQAFEQWLNHDIQLDWVQADVVKDSPSKIKQKAKKEEHLNFQLLQQLKQPEQSVDIVSAYFVPEKKGLKSLSELSATGVKIRVLTNSYKANDVPIVHAFYAKYREELLKNNIQLYEFLSAPELSAETTQMNTELAEKTKVSLKGLSRSSLHAKMMALDEKQVFIGSFNFDPRSAYLNTEIGVVLHSPLLARAIHDTMNRDLSKYAYQLLLDANEQIQWKLTQNNAVKIYQKEPKMKWWERAAMKMAAWLPIEGFM